MRLSLQKKLLEGEMIPRGYGIAWVDHRSYHLICLPFPVNHIARRVRAWWHRVRNVRIEIMGELALIEAGRIRDRAERDRDRMLGTISRRVKEEMSRYGWKYYQNGYENARMDAQRHYNDF